MRKSLLGLILVAGCGADDQPAGNAAAASSAVQAPGAAPSAGGRPPAPGLGRLTGLYEGGKALQPNQTDQLCMIDKDEDSTQFALVVWGRNMQSCSGSGRAVRDGSNLRLEMAGDETCAIDAKIAGTTITLPDSLPAGCSYYCGAQARMTGASFTRSGTTREDALKARDLGGDALCGGPG